MQIHKEQLKRDLEWILDSPQMFLPETPEIKTYDVNRGYSAARVFDERRMWKSLHSINAIKNLRLGIYYERLHRHLIESQPDPEILATNRQIVIENQTLGEFDLLYRLRSDGLTRHCEFALKYYLGVGDTAEPADNISWIGPNQKDRLDIKLQRLHSHQLILGKKPEVKYWMNASGIQDIDRVELCFQGILFYPFDSILPAPRCSTDDHPKGIWLPLSDVERWWSTQPRHHRLVSLSRLEWISGGTLKKVGGSTSERSKNAAVEQVLHSGRPLMFQILGTCQTDTFCDRVFIVPDSWCNNAFEIHRKRSKRTKLNAFA